MIWLALGIVTALYLLLWPFSLRLDARLSPTSGQAEVQVASLLRLRFEGDFLQPPYLTLYRLDVRGRRRPIGRKRKQQRARSAFRPVFRKKRLAATVYLGAEGDGALTVEALGLLYALMETLGESFFDEASIRPTPCFDKNICAVRLSGIGRFVLAQNILEYLKGNHIHAKR